MIVVVRKNNIALVGLIFLLLIALYSLNFDTNKAAPVTGEQQGTKQKVVILDAGHGGEDPGAVSDFSGLKEKDVNLSIVMKVKDLLERDNYKVILTRSEDVLVYTEGTTNITDKRRQDLQRRKKMMDESGADIVVSIHMNKIKGEQWHGAQTFYPPNSPESQKLAVLIQQSIKETADPENTRNALLKKEPIIILKNLKTPTAIVECGFLSNREEEQKLATDEYQNKLAHAIKNGIDKYYSSK